MGGGDFFKRIQWSLIETMEMSFRLSAIPPPLLPHIGGPSFFPKLFSQFVKPTPWSAEEMLDSQHQRVDIPAHARTAHRGLLQKRLEEDLC